MFRKMEQCSKDEKHTFDALCQLEDEPQPIDNMAEVMVMVQNEFLIWDSYKTLKETRER